MASDAGSAIVSIAGLGHGSQTPVIVGVQPVSGKSLPQGGVQAAAKSVAAPPKVAIAADLQALVAALNKFLNDSGRPTQFRVDPASANTMIQEINPANGKVLAEFAAAEFPALAKSVGASSILVDTHA
jgi:hypothetical protein